jgi:hypothetical protein
MTLLQKNPVRGGLGMVLLQKNPVRRGLKMATNGDRDRRPEPSPVASPVRPAFRRTSQLRSVQFDFRIGLHLLYGIPNAPVAFGQGSKAVCQTHSKLACTVYWWNRCL